MIISIEAEKSFDKIQDSSAIKVMEKLGMRGAYLNIIKDICDQAIDNIMLNEEEFKAFSLKSGIRQECPLSSTPTKYGAWSPS